MLEQDYIAKVLDLEDVIIRNVEIVQNELHIYRFQQNLMDSLTPQM